MAYCEECGTRINSDTGTDFDGFCRDCITDTLDGFEITLHHIEDSAIEAGFSTHDSFEKWEDSAYEGFEEFTSQSSAELLSIEPRLSIFEHLDIVEKLFSQGGLTFDELRKFKVSEEIISIVKYR